MAAPYRPALPAPDCSSTSGSVALNAATTYSVELNGNAPGNGTGKYDQLKVTGAVNLGGATLSASTRFTAAETDIFSIVTSTGVLSGTFAGLPDGALLTIGGRAYIIHYATNAATLAVVPNSAPVIDGGDNVALDVPENDTTVKTITATDTDTPAQTLTYSISGGADAAKFSIDGTSGKLTFQTAPNFEVPTDNDGVNSDNIYNVTVQVSDGTATDSQDLAVTVTDVNEAPVITSNDGGDTAAVNVAENTTAVTTVTATDVDAGQTKTFSISGGADKALFEIDGTTGVLTFTDRAGL